MATLAFAAIGNAVGAGIGGSLFGITAAGLGQAVGAIAGSYIDSALLGGSGQDSAQNGSQLSDLRITASTEGAPVSRVYGRVRISGQIIWATNFREEVTRSATGSGKGLNVGTNNGTLNYRYFANFAIALCEGEITRIGRVWADNEELTLSDYTYRVYYGREDQVADPLIQAKEGAENAPAYRGIAYVVFEDVPIEDFGNRIPQLNFEVFRAVDEFEGQVRGVTLIPAAGEFSYHPTEVRVDGGAGSTYSENRHTTLGDSDFSVSMDQLAEALPSCTSVSLFVAWFGSDLRCADCEIKPKVDTHDKGIGTTPISWSVAGLTRAAADEVSTVNFRPAFGGTPSDQTVMAAIRDMRDERGLDVLYTPFLLMDIPASNGLTDPYTGAADQPVYPWRGRITCDPAPGEVGSPDKTSAAATQVNAFYGTVEAADYTIGTDSVGYSGPNEWSYSRFILHNAALCAAAGGVSAFVIGSEMRALGWVRSSASAYPFVTKLKDLAAQVSILLPGAKITYAADWSEYFGHHPNDGSGDVYFHLDPLWSDNNIDAVAIDNYWPLSDWRDGNTHLDYLAGVRDQHDLAYLKSNIEGGEGYDFYYGSDADRNTQTRTSISDGGYGKPWVFRYKDIRNWWSNLHYNRPGGTESGTPTDWEAELKPIWFTEIGCPCVDKGANQPNVFYDPKSSESFFPYYSRGTRDDLIQRRYLKAFLEWYDEDDPNFTNDQNPTSTEGHYTGRMVDTSRVMIYTWDARPYPAFPALRTVWSDGDNFRFGHWLPGRVSDAPLAELVDQMFEDFGMTGIDASGLTGVVSGYVVDRPMSLREAIQPLEVSQFFDTVESGGVIRCRHRGADGSRATLTLNDLVETSKDAARMELVRGQESELPQAVKVTFSDVDDDYETGSAEARRMVGNSLRVSQAQLPIAMTFARAVEIAGIWLHESWSSRERAGFKLPLSRVAIEASDVVTISAFGREFLVRITGETIGEAIECESSTISPHVYAAYPGAERSGSVGTPAIYGAAVGVFLDIPMITGAETPFKGKVAAYSSPWPGGVAFYRAPNSSDYTLNVGAVTPANLGETRFDLYAGAPGRWDYGNSLYVRMYNGELASASELVTLGGANLIAVQNSVGAWEVVQFQTAELTAPGEYTLSKLLRGQFGTEGAIENPIPAGARVIVLDDNLEEVAMTTDERGLAFNWKWGPQGYAIDNPAFQTVANTFYGIGLRPYSPCHVAGVFNGGDLTISWIRRTRFGGDSWDQTEVPINEEAELYEVDIMDGSDIVRTLTTSSTSVTYSSAAQTADFGAPQSNYTVRVYQISATFGRGELMEAVIP